MVKTEIIGTSQGPTGWLVVIRRSGRHHEYRLRNDSVIGRSGRCDVVLDHDTVSEEHARIKVERDRFVIYDLGSTNHTYVNEQVTQKQTLHDGDRIRLGSVEVVFKEVHST